MRLTNQQQSAVDAALSGDNCFITGGAGTGKSTVIEVIRNQHRGNLVVLAPTGVAALNIKGETIHRFFGFPSHGVISQEYAERAGRERAELINAVDTFIIDEISMVRSDLFEAIDTACCAAADACDSVFPFAGKQVINTGDFSQLPPVVADRDIQLYFEQVVNGPYVFQTRLWRRSHFHIHQLTEPMRSRDPQLLAVANAIRNGDADRGPELDMLNERVITDFELGDDDMTALCCRRKTAKKINNDALDCLDDPGIIVHAEISGRFPQEEDPTDEELLLKRGEKVMLLANKTDSKGDFVYANGTVGTIENYVYEEFGPSIFIRLPNDRVIELEKHDWVSYEHELHQDGRGNITIKSEECGVFVQFPLAPAYARTIHKCQSMGFDCPVRIALDDEDCFAPGLLYTAITRCRELDQIYLDRRVRPSDYYLDEAVVEFYDDNGLW